MCFQKPLGPLDKDVHGLVLVLAGAQEDARSGAARLAVRDP